MTLIELVANTLEKEVEDVNASDIVDCSKMFVCVNLKFDVWLSKDKEDNKVYGVNK